MSCPLRLLGALHASTAPVRPAPAIVPPAPSSPRPFVPSARPTVTPRCIRAAVSIKIKDYGDLGEFSLTAEQRETLEAYLAHPVFCGNVRDNMGWPESTQARYAGQLFQPVPWSGSTPRGMPAEMERFADSATHAIINIPPPFMFKAKVFSPSRLCAVYEQVEGEAATPEES